MHTHAAVLAAVLAVVLYPASSFAAAQNYGFKLVGHPTDTSVAVELVNKDTSQPVIDAQLYTMRWVYGSGKGSIPHQIRVPLKAAGDGSFVVAAKPGDRLQLAATVPGAGDTVSGSLFVGS
jgi:hypothetical protein